MNFKPVKIAICIGCGCSDVIDCITDTGKGCRWLKVDRARGLGVCSECGDWLNRFKAAYATPLLPTPVKQVA